MKKSALFNIFGFLALLLVLNGCETYKVMEKQDAQMVADPDKVTLMLADAADRAAKAMEVLASVEEKRTPVEGVSTIRNAPVELRRAMTLSWVGPVEPISKTLADRASYNFITLGDAPPVPIVVTLDVENKPVIDILRDVGLQLAGRAKLVVDSRRRVVEIQYAPISYGEKG